MSRCVVYTLLIPALAAFGIFLSVMTNFGTWPWTVRHSYATGGFQGLGIGDTKRVTRNQIGILKSRVSTSGRTIAFRESADRWILDAPECPAFLHPVCTVDLYFSNDRLIRIVRETYYGPTDL
jgi:hypothetical protein